MTSGEMLLLTLAALAVAGFVGLNVVAFNNARRMTHFLPAKASVRCPDPSSPLRRILFLILGPRIPRAINRATPAQFDIPYTTEYTRTSDGVRIEMWDLPVQDSRGTFVILHGYASCKEFLIPEAQCVRGLGYNVVLMDFRGSGGSDGTITTIGVREALDVMAVTDWAAQRYPGQPILLLGVSMGAVATLRAVAHHNFRPTAMILHCPFDRLLTTVKHRFESLGAPSFPAAHLLVFWGGLQTGFDAFGHNPMHDARALTCPSLMLHASKDPRVTVSEVTRVYDSIAGPKEMHIFDGLEHESYAQVRPDEYRQVIHDWIARIEPLQADC